LALTPPARAHGIDTTCRFFSTLLLRPAKMNKALGSGSMSLVPLLPGRCATGIKVAVNMDMGKYQTLSEEQKAKVKAALEKKVGWGMCV
jgi:hypothetical protein